ncbi:MAG: DUF3604 domain-containing protein [candidate division KSB1 bacterium]|nr:DUF3604 domain-containing protein [candidate division KSB1 bacterium]MDZ7310896.1 DUF3604 domain-containing protein [candidate division KSB1 bacterium]
MILALFLGKNASAAGIRALVTPAVASVRTPGTWRVSLIVEADRMAVGGGVKVRFGRGFNKIQNTNPELAGYVEANTSNSKASVTIAYIKWMKDPQVPWEWDNNAWVVTALVEQQALSRGDTIHLVFGANPPKGRLLPSPTAYVDTILVAYDLDGSGNYLEVAQKPVIEIRPLAPYRLYGYLPTSSQIDTPATLKIVVRDYYDNLATSFVGTIALSATDLSAIFPKTVDLTPSDRGRKNLEVRFQTRGIHYLELRAIGKTPDSLWNVRSNPVKVALQSQFYQVFWGDLHSHSSFSKDGHGRDNFLKARDVACLDFYALTDHTSNDWKEHGGLTAQEWEATKREVIRYHQPGKFVTFPGYEFSAGAPSGHHNIYFNAPDERIPDIPVFADDVYPQVQKVWQLKDTMLPAGIDMLTVPHHTGVVRNLDLGTGPWVSFGQGFSNSKLRPLIEIYSLHGSSEWYAPEHPLSYRSLWRGLQDCTSGPHYAQDAWAAGETLGVIASSDDHSSRPGLECFGLTAVYARELTRDAVWDALKKRRTYATTGQRMIVHFSIDGYLMGSQIKLARGKYPNIQLEVHGTQDLDFVEVLRWDGRSRPYKNGHPSFEIIKLIRGEGRRAITSFIDSTYSGASIYYLRAKQKPDVWDPTNGAYRQSWAWSSPIWVSEPIILNAQNTELVPRQLQLRPNYPNPFARQTWFAYYVPGSGKVTVALHNILGQQVRPLLHEFQTAGWHGLEISAQDLPEGLYFIRLEAEGQIRTQKIIVMK